MTDLVSDALVGRETARGGQGEVDSETTWGLTTSMTIHESSCHAIKVSGGLLLVSARTPTTRDEAHPTSDGLRIVALMLCAAVRGGQAALYGGGEKATVTGGCSYCGGGVTITAMSVEGGGIMPCRRRGRGLALQAQAAAGLV